MTSKKTAENASPSSAARPLASTPNPTASVSRRSVLQMAAGAAVATPYFAWNPRTLADETKNDKIRIGLIGAGGMGTGNLRSASKWIDLVAVADVDSKRAEAAKANLSGGKADVYSDYRAILD